MAAVIGGTLIEKLHMERHVESFILTADSVDIESPDLTRKDRFVYAKEQMLSTLVDSSGGTIRVNGHDICQSVAENSCGCCSDISGTDVNCRVFEYNGELYEVPPKEMLAEAILKSIFGQVETGCSCGEYELPENLKEFYEGKKNKSSCSCGRNCC